MKNFTKTISVALVMFAVSSVGFGIAHGYGGFSSGGGGVACPYGYNFSTFSCNPAPVVTAPVSSGRVLGASTFSFGGYLRQGDTSDAVRELQERLRAEGFFTYPVSTGFFGPITFAAVQAYQSAHGVPSTGFVGSLTIASLNGNGATASANPVVCPVGFTCTPIANTAAVGNALTQ